MIDWKTIAFFVLTLLLMGFFAGIEMAFYSANRLNIELRKKTVGLNCELHSIFFAYSFSFLGTTLIGFNIFLVFLGSQISTVMKPIWHYLHIGYDSVHIMVEIIIATFLVLVFAEFIP